jgi:hypothetical protein
MSVQTAPIGKVVTMDRSNMGFLMKTKQGIHRIKQGRCVYCGSDKLSYSMLERWRRDNCCYSCLVQKCIKGECSYTGGCAWAGAISDED